MLGRECLWTTLGLKNVKAMLSSRDEWTSLWKGGREENSPLQGRRGEESREEKVYRQSNDINYSVDVCRDYT